MFWQYIAPIIYQVQEHIGCQYAYLFAADTSEDGNLINYYNVALKFEQPTEVGTNKPSYDLCCAFMCQEIKELRKNQAGADPAFFFFRRQDPAYSLFRKEISLAWIGNVWYKCINNVSTLIDKGWRERSM